MISLFSDITSVTNYDYGVLDGGDISESDIKSSLESQHPTKVFYVKSHTTYLVEVSKQTKQVDYIPCGECSIDEGITSVISRLKEFEFLVVKNKMGNIFGYIHTRELCERLFKGYQYAQSYISTILETIDESCTVIDSKNRVVVWTEGAEQIFSVKQNEIVGKPITDFFNPEHLEILNTVQKGTSVHHMQHKARENQVVLINSNPVYLNEEIIGAVVSESDITSQIRLNKELYNTTQKLFNLEQEVSKLTSNEDPFIKIRGNSPALKQTFRKIKKAASTDTNILIDGESGVGKELFAKAVHNIREGQNSPFIAINCGAIPSSLFESEIFGYEKGAFSGANQKGKQGKVELAKGGTLFLDEIGEMPLEMQVKILRLLQERKFYPVGGTVEKEADFRVIAATNRNLKERVKEGEFREDLYYRLNVVSIEVPPLRERPEDIIELTHYFLHEVSIKYNRPIHGISQSAMQALLKHDWPGNIRELKNVIERLVVFSDNGEIKMDDIPFETDDYKSSNGNFASINENDNRSLNIRLQEVEKEIILNELKKSNGNKLACAKSLQITRATLYNRINKLGINA